MSEDEHGSADDDGDREDGEPDEAATGDAPGHGTRTETESESGAESESESGAGAGATGDLTHVTAEGDVQMVDVGEKPDTRRRAVAAGEIRLRPATIAAVRADDVGKGDVLATARVGAVQAVKHTWETIPMCHQIPITNVDTAFDLADDRIVLEVAVETTGKTGCEMEALEGVTTGLNVVWDMVKAVEKDDEGQYPEARIETVRVVEKEKRSV